MVYGGVEPDTTPPAFVAGYPTDGDEEPAGSKKVNVIVNSDEDAQLYAMVSKNSAQPDAADIKDEVADPDCLLYDNFALTANSPYIWTVDLSAVGGEDDTQYYIHMFLEDASVNQSSVITYVIKTPAAVVLPGPTFTTAEVQYDNLWVYLAFNEGVYGDAEHTTAIDKDDLSLTYTSNGSPLTNVTIAALNNSDNTSPRPGDTTFHVVLSLTGNNGLATGAETITITPKDGSSIFNLAGVAMAADATTGPLYLNDTMPPTITATSVSYLTDTTVQLNFNSNEAGTYYYLVYGIEDPAPDAVTIKDQGTAYAKGSGAALADANTVDVVGLVADTGYKAYLIVEDAEGNLSEVATFTIAPVPTITGATLDEDNYYIAVTFSEPVYGDASATTGIDKDDFIVTFAQNDGGVVSGASIRMVYNHLNATPVGGETEFKLFLKLENGPPSGAETIAISPKANSIYGGYGREQKLRQSSFELEPMCCRGWC